MIADGGIFVSLYTQVEIVTLLRRRELGLPCRRCGQGGIGVLADPLVRFTGRGVVAAVGQGQCGCPIVAEALGEQRGPARGVGDGARLRTREGRLLVDDLRDGDGSELLLLLLLLLKSRRRAGCHYTDVSI